MGRKRTIPVSILGQEYRVRSDADAVAIRRAATLVDETMGRLRDRTGTVDTLDVAVLAALNLAHRLVTERTGPAGGAWIDDDRVLDLLERVESALADGAPPGR